MTADRPTPPTLYGYRWIVLLVYSLATLVLQVQWLTFAPVARQAQVVYGATPFEIDLLSLIFMLVFVIVGIPASQLIDRYGLRVGVGLGAALTGIFGLLKGFAADSYTAVVVGQVGLAIAQPLVLNAVTKLAAHWFPIHERATAVGLSTLAQFLGIILVMILTPLLVDTTPAGAPDLGGMLLLYGVVSAVAAVLLLALLRERPPTPPSPESADERLVDWRALRHLFAVRDMRLILALFFIGFGIFNALSTCIDQLGALRSLDEEQTGLVGGVMLIGGVLGAALLPPLSDRLRRRRPFIVVAMALTVPALAVLALVTGFDLLVVGAGLLGFFLLGSGAPVGLQYAAEVGYPAAESLSQGLILMAGQVSGILFIVLVNLFGILPLMWAFVALAVVNVVLALTMRESPRILSAAPRP